MTLPAGARLGPYEILSLIGAGGMGEVYKARDTRLARVVAVKLLPTALADRSDRRARFETEARAISSLNHPHICTLFDVGEQDGRPFLVMEHLDGETLDDRLAGGALPPNVVLRYAVEIADALDHAHREGIIHRDLKPSNVMLTASGVKLLDFGLARGPALEGAAARSTMSFEHRRLTTEGTMIGTFQYMAPEQLEGRDADTRTDIFAFGAVVYEMATGRKAFDAQSDAGRIGAILHSGPPSMASLRPKIPAALDRVVGRCLAKDPDHRWQSVRDLMRELEWIAEGATERDPFEATRRRRREPLAWITALILVTSAVSLAVWHFREALEEPQAVRFSVSTGQPPLGAESVAVSVSPDGRRLAFVAGSGTTNRLWIRSLDSTTLQPIAGTEGAAVPFWSPDGRFLAFGADGKLKKVAVSGGPVQTLGDAPAMLGGTWNRNGEIVFAPGNRTALFRISAAGGEAIPVTTLDRSRGENTHRFPHFLPDGRSYLYLARSTQRENSAIYVGSLDSSAVTRVLDVESNAVYAHPGYLLFARDGALLAWKFDARRLQTLGDPVQVVEDVHFTGPSSHAMFSVSERGVLAYATSAAVAPPTHLTWFTRAGTPLESPALDGGEEPSLAADGHRVVAARWAAGTSDLWVVDAVRGSPSRLTFDRAGEYEPIWSPDGNSIVFCSNRDGPADLYQIATSGTGQPELLLKSSAVKHATDWSSDGRVVVYESNDPRSGWDLWIVPVRGGGQATPFLQTEFAERLGRLSPNRRWMAYVSNESGTDEVYVRPFPVSSGKWKISTAGGTEPRWRRNGKELFFLAPDSTLMAVSVDAGSTFHAGRPNTLFETRMSRNGVWGYDVSPDGQRFVMNLIAEGPVPPSLTVVLNWTAGVPR